MGYTRDVLKRSGTSTNGNQTLKTGSIPMTINPFYTRALTRFVKRFTTAAYAFTSRLDVIIPH